jgi:hypothetical protein
MTRSVRILFGMELEVPDDAQTLHPRLVALQQDLQALCQKDFELDASHISDVATALEDFAQVIRRARASRYQGEEGGSGA